MVAKRYSTCRPVPAADVVPDITSALELKAGSVLRTTIAAFHSQVPSSSAARLLFGPPFEMQFYTNATSLFEMQFYTNATSLFEMQFLHQRNFLV
jgi:hypothetical protein